VLGNCSPHLPGGTTILGGGLRSLIASFCILEQSFFEVTRGLRILEAGWQTLNFGMDSSWIQIRPVFHKNGYAPVRSTPVMMTTMMLMIDDIFCDNVLIVQFNTEVCVVGE